MTERVREAADYVWNRLGREARVGLTLGSGLGALAEQAEHTVAIPYTDIPHYPHPTVHGHAGKLVVGKLGNMDVFMLQGRVHYYEGLHPADVIFPVYLLKELGIQILLVTNAAGSTSLELQPGNLMLITDHINNMGMNPLVGPNDDSIGPRFPDMSNSYDADLRAVAKRVATSMNTTLKEGVYCANSGPSYETPSEIRMMRSWGADAVGMSTVPEVIAANHCGLRVLGISCITNYGAGLLDQPLDHQEVIETGKLVADRFRTLILGILDAL